MACAVQPLAIAQAAATKDGNPMLKLQYKIDDVVRLKSKRECKIVQAAIVEEKAVYLVVWPPYDRSDLDTIYGDAPIEEQEISDLV